MGKRQELELEAIRRYAEGVEIPQIAIEMGVSENSLRAWRKRAGSEWDDARTTARKSTLVNMEDVGSRLRRSREIATQLTGDTKHQSSMGLILNQTIQTAVFDLLGQLQTVGITDADNMSIAIDQVNTLSLALGRLEQSATNNAKREREIRKDEREKALKDAADTLEKVGKKRGLSTATVQQIRSEILGIPQ
jgi:hypothetical protein